MAILLLHKFMSIVTILEFGARIGIQHHQVKSRGDLNQFIGDLNVTSET